MGGCGRVRFRCELSFSFLSRCWVAGRRPGVAPAGELLFFVSPKKPNEKKGDPQSGSLRFATGNLRCTRKAGVRANSPAAQTARGPDPAFLAQHRPSQDGLGGKKSESGSRTRRARSAGFGCWYFFSPPPSGCAEERRARRIRARACLSEASLHETPAGLSTAGCP